MTCSPLIRLFAVSLCLAVAGGCPLGGSFEEVPREPPVLSLAVGAAVTLELTEHSCDHSPVQACTYERPEELLDASLSDRGVAELGEVTSDGRSILAEVHALSPGEVDLVLEYEDFFGDRFRDRIVLRVVEIERVEARVFCDGNSRAEGRYPVLAASSFSFTTTAFAGDTELATGLLELVEDFGDFEVLDELEAADDSRRVTAPSRSGEANWTLSGADSALVEFVVFDAAEVGLELTEPEPDQMRPPGVELGRVVDDSPVCVFDGESTITVEVTEGDCRPVVSGFELSGQAELIMGEGDLALELAGQDECTITASGEATESTELTVTIDNPPPLIEPVEGLPLGLAPSEIGGELQRYDRCPRVVNLTDGRCDILTDSGLLRPDVDCLLDWDWTITHTDGVSEAALEGAPVGVGLWSELALQIDYEFILLTFESTPPSGLDINVIPTQGLEINSSGCTEEQELLALRAESEGDYQMRLRADNAYDEGRWTLRAREVDQVLFAADEEPIGEDALFFVGTIAELSASYTDASGAPLAGIAPVLVSTDLETGGATVDGATLYTGTEPQVILLASHAARQTSSVTVVDGEAIEAIGGLAPQQLTVDEEQCLLIHPLAAGGRPIHGPSPIRPQLSLTGDDALAVVVNPWPPIDENELCLRGRAEGVVDLELAWGTGTTTQSWTVR